MKKLIPFLFLMFVLAMTGCKKDDDTTPSTGADELTFTIDGKTIVFTTAHTSVSVANLTGTYLTSIIGNNNTGDLLGLNIASSSQSTGEFKLSTQGSIRYRFPDNWNKDFFSGDCNTITGSIKITEYDTQNKVISGTFSGNICDGDQQKPVSGSFNKLKY